MRKANILTIIVTLTALWLNSCTCRHDPKLPLDTIDVEVMVKRFDQDLFSINIDSIEFDVNKLKVKHSPFFELFCEGIIGIGSPNEPGFSDYLLSFINDNMVLQTYLEVQNIFPDTKEIDQILTNAFKRYLYYFPDKQIPAVYGFVSGFNNSVIIADSILGIGFDRYLGRNCEYYPRLGIHRYITYNMHSGKIPSDLLRAWAIGEFHFNDSIDNLLNNMIYEGKLMYFTKRMLPDQPDSLIFGFTPDHMKWCKRNESQMWAHLIEHKLLFSTESFTINQFISDAPFSHGFTRESPGRAAVWLGYRIVNKFMEQNKDYKISDLMNEGDYQKILSLARYNP
jgi:hypothetical protein